MLRRAPAPSSGGGGDARASAAAALLGATSLDRELYAAGCEMVEDALAREPENNASSRFACRGYCELFARVGDALDAECLGQPRDVPPLLNATR